MRRVAERVEYSSSRPSSKATEDSGRAEIRQIGGLPEAKTQDVEITVDQRNGVMVVPRVRWAVDVMDFDEWNRADFRLPSNT